jgi:hypothetical protein
VSRFLRALGAGLLLTALPCAAQKEVGDAAASSPYPPPRQVLSWMLSSTSPEQWPEPGSWSLARHPDGWMLMPCGAGQPWLLWDRVEGRFSDGAPDWPVSERSVEASRELAVFWLDEGRLEPLRDYPFWGYAGAAEHTLELLHGEGELDPAQLYAAGSLLLAAATRMPGSDPDPDAGDGANTAAGIGAAADAAAGMDAETDALLLGCGAAPRPDAERSLAWLQAALMARERLERTAPDFRGRWGRSELERAVLAGRAWLLLEQAGRRAEAEAFGERARFPDFYEAHGHNLMLMLPAGSEWTASDLLEWVLLRSLQRREGLRPDLNLLCCGQPGTSWPDGLDPDPASSSAMLTDVFRFEGADRARAGEPAARRITAGYRQLGLKLARSHAESGRPDEGLRVLNVLYRHLPEWVFAPSAAESEVVGFYYRYGSAERGGEIGLALYRVLAALPPESRGNARELMGQLEAWGGEHAQDELLARYAELRKASPR